MFFQWIFIYIVVWVLFFLFNQKTAYDMRISDWSSDVCSSDLAELGFLKSPKGGDYEVSKPVDSELLPSKTVIGIRKGNKELKALLDKGIKALHEDGKYAEIQKKHFGDLNLYSGK